MVMSPALSIVEAPRNRRITRSPTHSFYVETKPFGIYPFMIAPVLPGETLKNLLIQSRVVSDPVASPLVGWWKEYYFFYVKLRDLPGGIGSAVETMLLDPSATLGSVDGSSDSTVHYFKPGAGDAVNWSAACLELVVDKYFRDQDEAWNTHTIDGVPKSKLNNRDWMDSAFAQSEIEALAGDPAITPGEEFDDFEVRYRNWMILRQQHLTDMTFEDYLATFGVNVPASQQKGKPELLRFTRDWTYPSNTIDPETGAPSSALSWSIAERADKDRFFMEPGFIFGVTVSRPKMYRVNQIQSASVMLDQATSWMPAILKDDPSSSLRSLAAGAANNPFYNMALFVDQRDLFIHGDQFIRCENPVVDIEGDSHATYTVADTHVGSQYPADSSIAKLWVDRTTAEPAHTATRIWLREDGIVKLNILGTQMDYT